MLDLKMKQIVFTEHTILEECELHAEYGQLTVICGESGSGKSTLLKSLMLENEFASSYEVDGVSLLSYPVDKRQAFLYENVSMVEQEPIFLHDLSISDHIKMVLNLNNAKLDPNEMIGNLSLKDCIHKYPAQLSTGEQIRVAILLSFLKNTPIMIWDEPTASLDPEMKKVIIDMLHFCLEAGKMMIIATHDASILQEADIVYEISENKLNKRDCKEKRNIAQIPEKSETKAFPSFYRYFIRMKLQKRFSEKMIRLISLLSIAFLIFSFFFQKELIQAQTEQLNDIASNDFIIYKSPVQDPIMYSYSGQGDNISDDELMQLQQLAHIKRLDWRFDAVLNETMLLHETDPNFCGLKEYEITISRAQGEIDSHIIEDSVIFSTYMDQDVNDRDISVRYQSEGVYISQSLSKRLNVDADSGKGASITFELMIPEYNTYGKAWTETADGTKVFIDLPSCRYQKITVPIAGILKASNLGVTNFFENVIYMDRSSFEAYLSNDLPKQTVYSFDPYFHDTSIDVIPEGKESLVQETAVDLPWKPDAYTLEVDDLQNLPSVLETLDELGLDVESGYMNYRALKLSTENFAISLRLICGSVGVLMIGVYLVMQYINKKSNQQMYRYFHSLGISDRNRKQLVLEQRLLDYMICFGILLIGLTGIVLTSNSMGFGTQKLALPMAIIAAIFAFFLEILIPYLLERKSS